MELGWREVCTLSLVPLSLWPLYTPCKGIQSEEKEQGLAIKLVQECEAAQFPGKVSQ